MQLSDGVTWNFCISPDLIEWGREFSRILGIRETRQEYEHTIFFCAQKKAYEKNLFSTGDNKKILHFSFFGMDILHDPSTTRYLCILTFPQREEERVVKYLQMISALFPVYKVTMDRGGMLLHGALLTHPDMGGVAILAPGGTGKSTCARRVPNPWSSYCDDLMLVVRTSPSSYRAHPLPTWSNFLFNRDLPLTYPIEDSTELEGLFFLQKSDKDTTIPLKKADAAQWIYDSSLQVVTWFLRDLASQDQIRSKSLIFSNAGEMAKKIPSAILEAQHDGSFWKAIAMSLLGKHNIDSFKRKYE